MVSTRNSFSTACWALLAAPAIVLFLSVGSISTANAFVQPTVGHVLGNNVMNHQPATTVLQVRKISDNEIPKQRMTMERRRKLGIADDEDEYDLEMALDNNTDPFITKVIAGSLILAIMGGLIAGIIIPATTDYGEGVCQPLLTGGRC